jgi:hypothetical protein
VFLTAQRDTNAPIADEDERQGAGRRTEWQARPVPNTHHRLARSRRSPEGPARSAAQGAAVPQEVGTSRAASAYRIA